MNVSRHRMSFALAALGAAIVLWSYWATFLDIGERWATDPQYSHGFLVPLFAGYLLWMRRGMLVTSPPQPRWWGVGIVLLGACMRMASHYLYQPWLDSLSLLVVITGLVAAGGGRPTLRWSWPALVFLVFMAPLPYRFQSMLGGTLQKIATQISTYILQTCGVPAVSEGNVILLSNARLGVVEACSGLTMMVTFLALSTAVVMLTGRNWVERGLVLVSAIPIAVLANVARIVVTGLLFEANQGEAARAVFHDLAGWLMMPLGLGLLIGELYLINRAVLPGGSAPRQWSSAVAPTAAS